MKSEKTKLFLLFLIGGLLGILGMYIYQKWSSDYKTFTDTAYINVDKNIPIDKLTDENLIINYVKGLKQLPDYYITKKEARNKGWIPSKGNLCDVLPGNVIGGDHFSNREKKLPQGKYFEADVNYKCGNRNADRIVFTNNGDVWLTKNHYKTFQKQ